MGKPAVRVLAIRSPTTAPAGHWSWAAVSPDGTALLAQWTAECEVPVAFFITLKDGSPSVVTGENDWIDSPVSVALGWTTDGRAIVFLPEGPACGTGVRKAGVYAYDQKGMGELIVATDPDEKLAVGPSLRPRDVDAFIP
jgi:hypothetical protein